MLLSSAANLSLRLSILPQEAFVVDIFLTIKQDKINNYSALLHSAFASLLLVYEKSYRASKAVSKAPMLILLQNHCKKHIFLKSEAMISARSREHGADNEMKLKWSTTVEQ